MHFWKRQFGLNPHTCFFILISYFLSSVWTVINAQDIIKNDQLCPDPVNTGSRDERTMLINHNLRVISLRVSSLIRRKLLEDVPCNFDHIIEVVKFNGAGYPLQLSIQGIALSNSQWNFTGSRSCSSFVKFNLLEEPVLNNTQLCRMYKLNSLENESKNMSYPPSIWTLPANQLGFLPPVFKQSGEKKNLYMTILYKAFFAKKCIFQVQQYAVTSSPNECDHGRIKHQLCGAFSCADQHEILSKLGYLPFDVVVNTDDIIQEDGNIYIRSKNGSRNTTNFHAALFSGMTRAISFLFVLSILISCISYQLKPYLRPSSSFEDELARERSHDSHRRCYRRPNNSPVLPFSRTSTEEIQMEHSSSTHSSRPHRPRRYFHHTCHRSVAAAPADLPSYNNQVINPDFCQPPPPYETVQPPSYAESMIRGRPSETPVINPTTTETSATNPNK
ncbi:unnamed protein product [Allacma fusca]|uniref:Uncharacterized protein n=1 Tax=Allacma fusca TaxID=39272 RepID=A0A8J2NR05_9HEXA|nr:unnamed protein product [Allacma fusca]